MLFFSFFFYREQRPSRWMTISSLIDTHHLKSRSHSLPLLLFPSLFPCSLRSSNLHRASRVPIRRSQLVAPAFSPSFIFSTPSLSLSFFLFSLPFHPSHDKQCKQRHVIRVTRVSTSMYATSPSLLFPCFIRPLFSLVAHPGKGKSASTTPGRERSAIPAFSRQRAR